MIPVLGESVPVAAQSVDDSAVGDDRVRRLAVAYGGGADQERRQASSRH